MRLFLNVFRSCLIIDSAGQGLLLSRHFAALLSACPNRPTSFRDHTEGFFAFLGQEKTFSWISDLNPSVWFTLGVDCVLVEAGQHGWLECHNKVLQILTTYQRWMTWWSSWDILHQELFSMSISYHATFGNIYLGPAGVAWVDKKEEKQCLLFTRSFSVVNSDWISGHSETVCSESAPWQHPNHKERRAK